jgi:hypothetical protein
MIENRLKKCADTIKITVPYSSKLQNNVDKQ